MSDVSEPQRTTDRRYRTVEGAQVAFWCPACEEAHVIGVAPGGWGWDARTLTVTPSIKVESVQWKPEFAFHRPRHHVEPGERAVCHSFIRNGVWEFLGDCTHDLAGQKVPLQEWPDV